MVEESLGSTARELTSPPFRPVLFQLAPASVLLRTPEPPAYKTAGTSASTARLRTATPVRRSVQLRPPSALAETPSCVPAYRVAALVSNVRAKTSRAVRPSFAGFQVIPASLVLKTPEPEVPA